MTGASAASRPPPRANTDPAGGWRPPEGLTLATAGVGLIYAAHILYGALVSELAMAMDVAVVLILVGILAHPGLRRSLCELRNLAAPAALFAIVILVALLTLTPYAPGGPHPIWAYTNTGPAAVTVDKSTTIVEIVKLLGLGCFFLVGAVTGASDVRARTALNLTILAGALFALWAAVGHAAGLIYHSQPGRLEAHFLNPNTAGAFFGVLLVLTLGLLSRRLRTAAPKDRLAVALPLVAAALLFAGCLLATASRGAFTALLVALGAFAGAQVLTGRWKLTRATAGALAVSAVFLVLLALTGDMLMTRFFGVQDSAIHRVYIWNLHWNAFLGSPLFGYGLGSFETVNKTLISGSNFNALWNIRSALNLYLQWLEQAGLIGALPMFLCVGAILAVTATGALRRKRMTGVLFALLAADVLILVHGASDFAVETPSFAAFWSYLLGLQFAVAQGSSAQ